MRHNCEKVPAESKEALVQEKAESVMLLPKYIEGADGSTEYISTLPRVNQVESPGIEVRVFSPPQQGAEQDTIVGHSLTPL